MGSDFSKEHRMDFEFFKRHFDGKQPDSLETTKEDHKNKIIMGNKNEEEDNKDEGICIETDHKSDSEGECDQVEGNEYNTECCKTKDVESSECDILLYHSVVDGSDCDSSTDEVDAPKLKELLKHLKKSSFKLYERSLAHAITYGGENFSNDPSQNIPLQALVIKSLEMITEYRDQTYKDPKVFVYFFEIMENYQIVMHDDKHLKKTQKGRRRMAELTTVSDNIFQILKVLKLIDFTDKLDWTPYQQYGNTVNEAVTKEILQWYKMVPSGEIPATKNGSTSEQDVYPVTKTYKLLLQMSLIMNDLATAAGQLKI